MANGGDVMSRFLEQEERGMTQETNIQEMAEADVVDYAEIIQNSASGKPVELSMKQSFQKGIAEGTSFVGNIGHMTQAAIPWLPTSRLFDDKWNWDPAVFSPEETYGEDWYDLDYEGRRQRIVDLNKQRVLNTYGYGEGGGVTEFAGQFATAAADPTTLLPVGRTIEAAAAIGMGVGSVDAIMYDLAQKGEIETNDVLLGANLGIVIGPALNYAGAKVTSWIRNLAESKDSPITASDMERMNVELNLPEDAWVVPQETADAINEAYDRTGKSKWGDIEKQAKLVEKGQLLDVPLNTMIVDARMDLTKYGPRATKEQRKYVSQLADKWNIDQTYTGEARVKALQDKYGIEIKDEKPVGPKKKAKKYVKVPEELRPEIMKKARAKKMEADQWQADNFMRMADSEGTGFATPDFIDDLGPLDSLGPLTGQTMPGPYGKTYSKIVGQSEPHTSPVGQWMYNEVGKIRNPNTPMTQKDAEKLARNTMLGELDAAASLPETTFRSYGQAGMIFADLMRETNVDINVTLANKELDLLKTLYATGVKEKKTIFTKDMPGYTQIPGILGKTIDPKDAEPMARVAAKEFGRVLDKTIDDSVEAGVMTAKQGAELKASAAKDGYWPRVWDNNYIDSPEGRKEWVKAFTGREWTQEEVENLMQYVGAPKKVKEGKKLTKKEKAALEVKEKIGREKAVKKAVLEGKIQRKGKMYSIPKSVAEAIFEKRRDETISSRSVHLERERKLLLPEDVIQKFLVKDPMTVMSMYLRDAYKRIHMAQRFGSRDEVAVNLWDEVGETIGEGHKARMQEVFYTMAGDPASQTIRKFTEMNPGAKELTQKAISFETLDLALSTIANSTQALVNGFIALERFSTSPYRTFKAMGKGVRTIFDQAGREMMERSGAAAETSMVQILGDVTAQDHAISRRLGRSKIPGINYLNYPSKFLRMVGYMGLEKINRIYGAAMGKALLEDIVAVNTRLLERERTHGLSKLQKYQLKKNKNTLIYLGINPEIDPQRISVNELLRGAQKFSNEINFTGAPDQLPVALQGPYTKLFFQFKSYVVKQSNFLIKNIVNPIRREPLNPDSYRPVYALLAGYGMGYAVDSVRRMIMGDDREITELEKMVRSATAVGGLAIVSDVALNASYSDAGLLSWLAGPTLGDLSGLAFGATKSITSGEYGPIAREIMATVPPFPTKKAWEEELKEELE